ncbi:MAG: DNA polymerase Y family protein [Burkholderiales bacterium]|jgi:protein ImuB|nr:DNA polymerase Y family protein [Burkholderiales bacterium]
MLWIAVRCHRLALDCALRGQEAPLILAICNRLQVLHASEPAQALGIRPGLRRASALSMASALQIIEHNPALDHAALEQIAGWLLQFTPCVSLQPPDGVLIEVEASLQLFGGRDRLLARIREGLDELGFTASLAIAPTAIAAWLLAGWHDRACIEHESLLAEGLALLPVEQLAAAAPHRTALAAIGVRCFADLMRLPRAGLAKRYGKALLFEIDAALGHQADPRRWFEAPARFSVRLELLAQVEHAEALLFASNRLLLQLCGWLAARRCATREALLSAEHDSGRHACEDTRITLRLTQPSRDPQRLLAVLRERLAIVKLPAPAHTLRLDCTTVVALPGTHGELFPTQTSDAEGLSRLIERLQSRLGHDQVQRLLLVADHRPEVAYRAEAVDYTGRQPDTPLPGMPRPLWLLNEPVALAERDHRPWWHGPLTLLAGPERIETGWWDEHRVQRDYFIAQGESTGWVWIYRTRLADADSGWFLQGVFG